MNEKKSDSEIASAYRPTKSCVRCAFCDNRNCKERVFSENGIFDEVACRKHLSYLHRLSDIMMPGVVKVFSSSTDGQRRGNARAAFQEFKRELKVIQKIK